MKATEGDFRQWLFVSNRGPRSIYYLKTALPTIANCFMLAFCPLIVRICWELSSNDDLACFSNAFALRRVEGQTLLTHRESSPRRRLTRGKVRQGCHIAWDLEPGLNWWEHAINSPGNFHRAVCVSHRLSCSGHRCEKAFEIVKGLENSLRKLSENSYYPTTPF